MYKLQQRFTPAETVALTRYKYFVMSASKAYEEFDSECLIEVPFVVQCACFC